MFTLRDNKSLGSRRSIRGAGAGLAIGMVANLSRFAAPPVASATVSNTETVVQVVTRAPYGKMLATVAGRSLYIKTTQPACTGGCLTIWPPLVMAAGKTVPKGVTGLGTASITVGGKHASSHVLGP